MLSSGTPLIKKEKAYLTKLGFSLLGLISLSLFSTALLIFAFSLLLSGITSYAEGDNQIDNADTAENWISERNSVSRGCLPR